jgi:hypothetical protein
VKRLMIAAWVLLIASSFAQTTTPNPDVLGMHNLSLPSGASVFSQGSLGCTF